eukprot:CAMPEP_0113671936 /NCGR_PEP_ID=MMETSP0038_2-20120614/5972_1 /TAXON_ID=2898 /ORGANISM="Cryptomonas paramecium" /LENGTH=425 /DNA_ID=CAMNT_0000588125 /DNA_START=203 /DNA_END=1478 /DNA_ORIENTATION=+ /assembly_acc=CAM_ASM_000170
MSCPFQALAAAMDENSEFAAGAKCPVSGRTPSIRADLIPTEDEDDNQENKSMTSDHSPKGSVAGSYKGSQIGSQIGSVASGLRGMTEAQSADPGPPEVPNPGHRSNRDIVRTSAPPYSPAQLAIHSPHIKKSWAMLLTKVAWVELGSKLYDTIFRVAPELQNMFSKSSVAMGIKMIDMIDSMVNAVDDLHTLHSKMESLGPVHNKNRVKAVEHMGIFESVIVDLLVTNLKEQLTQEMRTGWKWLWAWLTESMLVVEKAYDTASSLIQQSWDSTLERCSPEEIGDCIYDTLFQIAPNLRHLFSKPKEIMAMKLVGIVGALVALSAHPETVDEVVRDLGRRHVTYGVASHHVPVMKQAIIAVLERMLGENWDARTSKAWNELWDVSATAMMKAIDDGRDFGGAMENLWERVKGKVARNKFALQLYSR